MSSSSCGKLLALSMLARARTTGTTCPRFVCKTRLLLVTLMLDVMVQTLGDGAAAAKIRAFAVFECLDASAGSCCS